MKACNNDHVMYNCKKSITDFIHVYLGNNIDKLCDFDFSRLEGDRIFGCTNRQFDCDDTNLARSIYYVVWGGKLPALEYDQIGTGKIYRGDTINTFSTLFGRPLGNSRYSGAAKYSDEDSFVSIVNIFHKTYRTVGNFMLLPNMVTGATGTNATASTMTINQLRGCRWRDYFDRFLLELKYCLTNDGKADIALKALVASNKFYFAHLDYSFSTFICANFLDKYVSTANDVHLLFEPYEYHWRLRSKPNRAQAQHYVNYATKYIAEATEVIHYRTSTIISDLKRKL